MARIHDPATGSAPGRLRFGLLSSEWLLGALLWLLSGLLFACGGGGGGGTAGPPSVPSEADLTGGAVAFTPSQVLAGTDLEVSISVDNVGVGSAPAFEVAVFLSTDATWDAGDTRLGSWSVASLDAGATYQDSAPFEVPAAQTPGVLEVLLVVDELDQVLELDETNNVSPAPSPVTVQPATLANLAPTSFSFAPFSVEAGQTIDVDDVIENSGVIASGTFRVGVYLSLDAIVTTSDVLLGHRAVMDLAPGASDVGQGPLTVPQTVVPGNYHVGVIADDEDVVVELTELDNVLVSGLLLEITAPPAPDLVADSLVFSPGAVQVGDTIFVDETVANIGNVDAGVFQVGVYLSDDSDIDPAIDTLLGFRTLPELTAGANSSSGTVGLTLPPSIPAGNYFIGVLADNTELVTESSETNNAYVATSILAVGVAPLPDLAAHSLSFSPQTVQPGTSSTLTVDQEVRNVGPGNAGPFRVSVYLSDNSVVTQADTRLGSRTLASLGNGAASAVSAGYSLPPGLDEGSYFVALFVDDLGAVTELTESNNLLFATGQLDVSAATTPEPNLIVEVVDPLGSSAAPGATLQVVTRVKNVGTASAAQEFWIGVYLSDDADITTADTLIGERRIPFGLGIGFSSAGSHPVTIPVNTPEGSTYKIGAIVDYRDQVAESDETDNDLAATGSFGVSIPRANLLVSALDVPNLGPFAAGDSFDVEQDVRNSGAAASGAFRVGIYLSDDNSLDRSTDVLLDSRVVNNLVIGATNSDTMTVTVPAGTAAGDWYVGVWVDDLDEVDESSETDNDRVFTTGTVTVQ